MSQEPKANVGANVAILLYAVGLTLAGVGIAVCGYVLDWGFMAYFGGGILAVAGGGMLVSRLRGGLQFVTITCPRCQHAQTYAEEALDQGRVAPCKGCFEYLERGPSGIAAVPEDRVAAEPVFEAPYPPTGPSFGGCALCGAAPTRSEEIKGSNVQSGVVGRKRITRTLQVPVCDAHAGQRAVELRAGDYIDGLDGFALRFRAYAQRRQFVKHNPAPMKVSAAAVTFGRS